MKSHILSLVASQLAFVRARFCCAVMALTVVALSALPATAIPTANLVVWLDADNLTGADGSTIAAWNDASGNGHHALAYSGNTATHPTLQNGIYAGHNAVRFTSATALRNNTIPSLNDMTVFAVYQWNSLSTQNWYLSFGSFDPEFGVGSQSTNATVYDGGYQQYNLIPQTTDLLYRSRFVRSGGSQNTLTLADGTTQTLSFPYTATATTYQLGAQSFGAIDGTANIDLAELIIYNGALDEATQQMVWDYLEQKFDPQAPIVPEPSTGLLLACCIGSLIGTGRRRVRRFGRQ